MDVGSCKLGRVRGQEQEAAGFDAGGEGEIHAEVVKVVGDDDDRLSFELGEGGNEGLVIDCNGANVIIFAIKG